jgi:ribosomal-protein-alanine N-acetyltransferase
MAQEIPTITTPRLTLRAFTEADVEPLFQLLAEPDVLRYFPNPGPPARDRVEKLVARQSAHWAEHGYGWWAVDLRADGAFAGWNGLQYLPETGETEIGYLLGKPFWGKGLATEGARAGLRFGFEELGLEKIVAIVHPDNVASRRVIEKLGMSGRERAHYFGMDVYHYALKRQAFRES